MKVDPEAPTRQLELPGAATASPRRRWSLRRSPTPAEAPSADICLVLEGTYPFVLGGVSAWIHGLIKSLPELTFHLWYVGPDEASMRREKVYSPPANVVGMTTLALSGHNAPRRNQRSTIDAWARHFPDWLSVLVGGSAEGFERAVRAFTAEQLAPVDAEALLRHPDVWKRLLDLYETEGPSESLIHYFWTCVHSLQPVIRILGAPIPKARCYHSISTGYAGLLAARAHHATDRPMLITEHGIYTKERRIEIHQADWIPERKSSSERPERRLPYFRAWWNRIFAGMSLAAYEAADRILTIHYGNTALQIRDGANPARMEVIPNGIATAPIEQAVASAPPRPVDSPFSVGFIGRIAPIKDVITLIDATALAIKQHPNLLVRIMGPSEEDPAYERTCREHAERLRLGGHLRFEGRVDVHKVLPELDVVILTSVSEAQPLVILEGYAAGLPAISTDVGAAREMLFGRSGADRALGAAGILTPIGSPVATAAAIVQLARDRELCRSLGQVGRKRVQQFYPEDRMVEAYKRIYQTCLHGKGGRG